MIDGDHSYDGVKRDFEMYEPLVGEGKPIAFHDIVPHPQAPACEVDRFWNEIKGGRPYVEFVDRPTCPANTGESASSIASEPRRSLASRRRSTCDDAVRSSQ